MATATRTVQRLRSFLMGKEYNIALRYTKSQQPRTQEPPNLPFGVAHKLSDNYYVQRDTRREHGPPTVITSALQIEGKDPKEVSSFKPATPNDVYQCT